MNKLDFPRLDLVHKKDIERFCYKDYMKFFDYYNIKYKIAKQCSSQSIAEIGVRAGYSAYSFLKACPSAIYYGFDNNQGIDGGMKGLGFHKHSLELLKSYTTFIRPDFNSQKAKQLIDEDDKLLKVDFVHVDADHSYKGTLHDLRLAKKTEAKWILIDDVLYIHKVGHAVNDFLLENSNYTAEYFADCRGEILICTKK